MGGILSVILVGVLLLAGCGHSLAPTRPVNTVPTRPQGMAIYVSDLGGMLNDPDRQAIRARLHRLDQAGFAQIAVLTLPRTDRELSLFSHEILNAWGVGQAGKNNGILLTVNAERVRKRQSGNRIYVAVGYGLEGSLPDGLVGRILDSQAMPAFDQQRYSQGIANTAIALADTVERLQTGEGVALPAAAGGGRDEPFPLALFVVIMILLGLLPRAKRRYGWDSGYYGGWGSGGFTGGGGFGGGFGGGSSGGGGAGR